MDRKDFQGEALRLAHLLRLGRDAEVQQALVTLVERLMTVVSQRDVRWLDWFYQCMLCQEHQDWIGLADALEHVLPELLAGE